MSSTEESGGGSLFLRMGSHCSVNYYFYIHSRGPQAPLYSLPLTTLGIIGAEVYVLLQLLLHYANVLHPDATDVFRNACSFKLMEGQEGLTSRAW